MESRAHEQEAKDTEMMQAKVLVYKHVYNYISSMSLKCAVELGIPDIIHNHGRPITLTSLVSALSLPPTKADAIHRLMRLLVHSGIFVKQKIDENQEEQEEEGYMLTPASRLLLKRDSNDKHLSLSSFVTNMLRPASIAHWHSLSSWFQGSGSTAFEVAHGMTFWSFMEQYPVVNEKFNDAMASDSSLMTRVIVNEGKVVFENLRSLVDVGGGTGTTAQAISEAFPHLECLVFDLPHVIANHSRTATIRKNVEYIGGDMFESIPHADAIFMKFVLHNWGDNECVKILKRCKEAIPPKEQGGKVIIVDVVIMEEQIKYGQEHDHERTTTELQLFFDIMMMTLFDSKERTKKEWEKLFMESGFTDYKITPLSGFRSLIEVYP